MSDVLLLLTRAEVAELTGYRQRGGRPYSYRTVRDMWHRATLRAGVEDAHLHDLRAKAITDAKRQGHDAQALGGHTTEAMTLRYIRDRATVVAIGPVRVGNQQRETKE